MDMEDRKKTQVLDLLGQDGLEKAQKILTQVVDFMLISLSLNNSKCLAGPSKRF